MTNWLTVASAFFAGFGIAAWLSILGGPAPWYIVVTMLVTALAFANASAWDHLLRKKGC